MVKSDPDAVVIDVGRAEEDVSPVSFTRLFRFSTRLEIFLDFIGVVAAVGAGAAQVMPDVPLAVGWMLITRCIIGSHCCRCCSAN